MLDQRIRAILLAEAKKHESFYLYDEAVLDQCIRRLQYTFYHEQLLYSIKCNPHRTILKKIFSAGIDADAASLGEVYAASDCGVPLSHIFYSAPGKTDDSLEKALGQCILIADSLQEIRRIDTLAGKRNMRAHIGVRINPDFSFTGNQGSANKFGIDEQLFLNALPEIKSLEHVMIIGLHTHVRSQELDWETLLHYYQNVFAMAKAIQERLGEPLLFLNLGSGIGIPYRPDETSCAIDELARGLEGLRAMYEDAFAQARIIIESGRYLAGPCGWYVTHVVDTKESYGKHIAILNSTLNGFLRPSLEQLVTSANPAMAPREPLFYKADSTPFYVLNNTQEMEKVTIYGNLCTAADIIAADVLLPKLSPGDVIAFPNAGAYSAVLTPFQFSSQIPPEEIYYDADSNQHS